MTNSDALEEATSRLTSALESFENTIAQRRQQELAAEALEEKVRQLTTNLDAERERSKRLARANDEVSERLDAMIGTIRSMLPSG